MHPEVSHSFAKAGVIRDVVAISKIYPAYGGKISLLEQPAKYQLVGRVMAYQGNDA